MLTAAFYPLKVVGYFVIISIVFKWLAKVVSVDSEMSEKNRATLFLIVSKLA